MTVEHIVGLSIVFVIAGLSAYAVYLSLKGK